MLTWLNLSQSPANRSFLANAVLLLFIQRVFRVHGEVVILQTCPAGEEEEE